MVTVSGEVTLALGRFPLVTRKVEQVTFLFFPPVYPRVVLFRRSHMEPDRPDGFKEQCVGSSLNRGADFQSFDLWRVAPCHSFSFPDTKALHPALAR